MRRTLWSTGGALALALVAGAPQAEGQIISATWLYPVESINFSDFDPFSPGQQPDLFSLDIVGGAGESRALWIRVSMVRPNNVTIFTGWSNAVMLSGAATRLTNRQLASTSHPFAIKNQEDFDVAELYDGLTGTGRFPAGTYRFEFRLCENPTPDSCEIFTGTSAVLVRDLANPTRVDLLGPGRPFGEPPPVVASPSPRFLWTTDSGLIGGIGEYRLRVARLDDAGSGEEAIRGFAVWETVTNQTSAVYPGSAQAVPLAAGAAYVWQVTRQVRTSGGVELLESPIYWFRMSAAVAGGGQAGGSGVDESPSRQISQLAELLGLGQQLEGVDPQGTVLVDGVPTSLEALQDLLRRIISGEATVQSITVR